MHIFFSGIGGHGIGPLALFARQAGYDVSGSDAHATAYTAALQNHGIHTHIGQTRARIAAVHAARPIDWVVYSSAVSPNNPELLFAKQRGIKTSKRDELLNKIIADHRIKLIAIAGTHGKTTTTAMIIWLCQQIGLPISYLVGAKINFGPMGLFDPKGQYMVYECDEFDRNFLAFYPYLSIITGVTWDHHEIFPTLDDYEQAFRDFIGQSNNTIMWQEDSAKLKPPAGTKNSPTVRKDNLDPGITLAGAFNRQDAWQAVLAVHKIAGVPVADLIGHVNRFPGLEQRMEQLAPNLYINYAHTPEKIRGGMLVAQEIVKNTGQKIVVIYEPLTNRRQHYIKKDYKNCFDGAAKLYWLPTYLAREDPGQSILTPEQLIPHLSNAGIAQPAKMDAYLIAAIHQHLQAGDLVVGMGANGANSLDEWMRQHTKVVTT